MPVTPKNIIIIEDDPDTLTMYRETLEEIGFHVFPCLTGVMAMSLLDNQTVDLILTDIRMPDIDMNHLIGYLSLHYPKIPIVIATAYPEYENLTKKRRTTVKAFFLKPVDLEKLKAAISQIAGHPQS